MAALDPSIPGRMLATHPATGWCHGCRAGAPCPSRRLAELAAEHVPRRFRS